MPRIESLSKALEILGKLSTLHRLLADDGVSDVALQWPISDPAFRKRLADFWVTHGYQETSHQKAIWELI